MKVHNLKVCDFLGDRSEENSIPDIKVSWRYISWYTANSVDSYIHFSLFSSLHNSEVISEKWNSYSYKVDCQVGFIFINQWNQYCAV